MKKYLRIIAITLMLGIGITVSVIYFNSTNDSSDKIIEKETVNVDDNPLIEMTISPEEAESYKNDAIALTEEYIDKCGMDISDSNRTEKRQEYVDYLGSMGYTAGLDFYNGELKNYEKFDKYCENISKALMDGKKKVSGISFELYYIQVDGSLLLYHFDYLDGKVIFTAVTSNIDAESGKINAPFITRYELYTFKYTERGWLFIEQFAEENNEMNGHQAIRVKPFNAEYKELCNKYVERIGYQCNNLFISEWNENDYSSINFNDLFEFLYYQKTGEELDHDAFYDGIPENEFNKLTEEYFNITDEKLKEFAKFNTENNTFLWARIGCLSYSPDISGEPFAEVTGKRESEDGTLTLIINTVWEWYNTDTAFVQELTIRQTKNGFTYVSNYIVPDENNRVPIYKHRV